MGTLQAEVTARANAVPGGSLASLRIFRKACVAGAQRGSGMCSQQGWRGRQRLEAEHWGDSERVAPVNRGGLDRKEEDLWVGGVGVGAWCL